MQLFEKSEFPLAQSGSFDQLVLDYLENDAKIQFSFDFTPDLSGLNAKLESQKSRRPDRSLLAEVLKDQYAFIDNKDEKSGILDQISLLKKDETYTICTGHQLNLFSGPLYTIFKIITTIKAASELSKSSGKVILPIFWLATEDHDMDEIDHVFLYNQRYDWLTDWKGASGRASCEGIVDLLTQLRAKFGTSEGATKWLGVLESCYRPEYSLAHATRRFIHTLFGSYGLLILDADDPRLKKKFVPEMLNDVFNHVALENISATIEELEEHYKIQVHPRQINLFYLSEHSRDRIEFNGDIYHVLNGTKTWTRSALEQEITENPERFSPNVVMRPLYQEKILPNVAVVGGPAEIAYWLELKKYFLQEKISFPVLLLRNSAMFLDEQAFKRMNKLHIHLNQVFESTDEWIRNYLKGGEIQPFSADNTLLLIEDEFSKLSKELEKIDPTIKGALEAEQQRIKKSLLGMKEKVLRTMKKKNETEVNQIHKLRDRLFPFGKLQERTENILPFLFKYDIGFIAELMKSFDPFNKKIILFNEKEPKNGHKDQ